jgi:hypothetical protein
MSDLDERSGDALATDGSDTLAVTIPPNDVVTLRIEI